MRTIQLYAFGKINLSLNITGVAQNGYHYIDTVMQTVSIYDMLTVTKAGYVTVRFETPFPERLDSAETAARKFFEAASIKGGADIYIQKGIPAMAGLGGASTDAAAVIHALDMLYETRLAVEDKQRIAFAVGSDAPFFITGGCARVKGLGEKVEPLQHALKPWILLVKPKTGVRTEAAYSQYDAMEKIHPDVENTVRALKKNDISGWMRHAGNSLDPAAKVLCPKTVQIKKALKRYGAQFSMVTGSGSTVFGIFADETAACDAAKRFSIKDFELVAVVKPVNRAVRAIVPA